MTKIFWIAAIALLYGQMLFGQSIASPQGPLLSFDRVLQSHGVPLTTVGLIAGLRNIEPQVRSAAALKLAENKAGDSAPAIAEALEHEATPRVYADIALALAILHDERGNAALERMCSDENMSEDLRLSAVRRLLDLGQQSCLGTLREDLASSDTAFRMEALTLARRFKHLEPSDAQSLSERIAPNLTSDNPEIRIAASDALARLGFSWSAALLETALSGERNQNVRNHMASDLSKLKSKKP